VRRKEIEENLRDDIAFREELILGRDLAREKAKSDYLAALAEIDERIIRAEIAIEKWKKKLADSYEP